MNRKIVSGVTLALLFSTVCTYSHLGMGRSVPSSTGDGVYCIGGNSNFDRAFFAATHKQDGSLVFAMDVNRNGFFYSLYGPAEKVKANAWRYTDHDPAQDKYPEAKCVVDITYDNQTWRVTPQQGNSCAFHRGDQAPAEAPAFTAQSYIGAIPQTLLPGPEEETPGDNLQIMANAGDDCSFYSKPYTPPYSTAGAGKPSNSSAGSKKSQGVQLKP